MLVLSRKYSEEIIIGEKIRIQVVRIRGNTVRIGIEAPEEMNVRRGELPPAEPPIDETKANPVPKESPPNIPAG